MAETHFSAVSQDGGVRLDLFLSRQTGHSRVFVQEQIEKGKVRVNGTPAEKAATRLRIGDAVEGEFLPEAKLDLKPIQAPLDILFEDEYLLAINKPQGLVVHPATGHRGETLVHHLLYHLLNNPEFPELSVTRPGIVHRLDRGTSGVILVAKSRPVQEELSRQFKAREIKKEYESIVWGLPRMAEGVFRNPIGRHRSNRKKMSSKTNEGRTAVTRWRCLEKFTNFSHWALFPETGRTHQLRVHCTEAGHPIAGDSLYATGSVAQRIARLPEPLKSILSTTVHPFLHAKAIVFTHPISQQSIRLEALRPKRFEDLLPQLREFDKI